MNESLTRRNLVHHGLLAAAGVAASASLGREARANMAALANALGPLPAGTKIERIFTWLTGAASGSAADLKARLNVYDGGTLQTPILAGLTWQDTLLATLEAMHSAITNLLGPALYPTGRPRPIDQFEKCVIECAIDKMPQSPTTQPITQGNGAEAEAEQAAKE